MKYSSLVASLFFSFFAQAELFVSQGILVKANTKETTVLSLNPENSCSILHEARPFDRTIPMDKLFSFNSSNNLSNDGYHDITFGLISVTEKFFSAVEVKAKLFRKYGINVDIADPVNEENIKKHLLEKHNIVMTGSLKYFENSFSISAVPNAGRPSLTVACKLSSRLTPNELAMAFQQYGLLKISNIF